MDVSSARTLCQNLIAFAIQRCQKTEALCRLTISANCSRNSDHYISQISGVGSTLTEFQDIDYAKNYLTAHNWDGLLSITTTSASDKEIYSYRLNLKENDTVQRVKRLPSTPKNGGKFSGTKVSFFTEECVEDLVTWIDQFCQKILILNLSVAIDLEVEFKDDNSSRHNCLIQADENVKYGDLQERMEGVIAGFVNFITRHNNKLREKCQICFSKNPSAKTGSGVVCSKARSRNVEQIIEVVIVVLELPLEPSLLCQNLSRNTTKVLYFEDSVPASFPIMSLRALTGINWMKYGFTFKTSSVDLDGNAVLDWENSPSLSVAILIHHYKKRPAFSPNPRDQADWKLLRKAVKLALDNLKIKHPGYFLSQDTVKISGYVPDLSRSVASLVSSSMDLEFQKECGKLLGLNRTRLDADVVESCIREKITNIIYMNDSHPKQSKKQRAHLFSDKVFCEVDMQNEEQGYEGMHV